MLYLALCVLMLGKVCSGGLLSLAVFIGEAIAALSYGLWWLGKGILSLLGCVGESFTQVGVPGRVVASNPAEWIPEHRPNTDFSPEWVNRVEEKRLEEIDQQVRTDRVYMAGRVVV